jgi:two-component system sensor histidine kinase CpxA
MAAVVEEFGRGRFAARTGITRSDEIGELARAVDGMAQRIETLVSAERRLLQDVSHELRSPLTRLNLAVELSRTATDREAAAARLQRDVDRLSRLVGALLEVTRLEGEGQQARQAPVDVAALAAAVIADVEIEARARDVSVESALAPAAAVGDPELLRRAFENVVRNAIRYAPHGSAVKVTVSASSDGVALTVLDAGPGVPEESIDRLGTPFFRVDAARDAASGGVGLGLAIARRAIERHAGTWQIENAHPGLRVRLSIPVAASASRSPAGQ